MTATTATCLDVMLSSVNHSHLFGIASMNLSDHFPTFLIKKKITVKKFWRNIQELLPGDQSSVITAVRPSPNDELCQLSEAPDVINDFFSNVGTRLDESLPTGTDPQTRTPSVRTLRFDPFIPCSLVGEYLRDIKESKPSGCLRISTKLYLLAFTELIEQITFLFNLSIKTNRVPTAWKTAMVTPIPKKGDRSLLNNIRPISRFETRF